MALHDVAACDWFGPADSQRFFDPSRSDTVHGRGSAARRFLSSRCAKWRSPARSCSMTPPGRGFFEALVATHVIGRPAEVHAVFGRNRRRNHPQPFRTSFSPGTEPHMCRQSELLL
jgi:hypothetical protein